MSGNIIEVIVEIIMLSLSHSSQQNKLIHAIWTRDWNKRILKRSHRNQMARKV